MRPPRLPQRLLPSGRRGPPRSAPGAGRGQCRGPVSSRGSAAAPPRGVRPTLPPRRGRCGVARTHITGPATHLPPWPPPLRCATARYAEVEPGRAPRPRHGLALGGGDGTDLRGTLDPPGNRPPRDRRAPGCRKGPEYPPVGPQRRGSDPAETPRPIMH